MQNKKKIPSWIVGGIISLLFFFSMNLLINPLLEPIRTGSIGHMITEIINAPLLILSVPLYVFYSYLGFFLDAIFDTGVGYESLGMFLLGVIFIKIFSVFYFFLIGAFSAILYEKIKKKR